MTGTFSKVLIGAVGARGAQVAKSNAMTSWVGSDIFQDWHACKTLDTYTSGSADSDSMAAIEAYAVCNIACKDGSLYQSEYIDEAGNKFEAATYPVCQTRGCKRLHDDPCYLNAKRVIAMTNVEPNLQKLVDAVNSAYTTLSIYPIHAALDQASPLIKPAEAAYSNLRVALTKLQAEVVARDALLLNAETFLAGYTVPLEATITTVTTGAAHCDTNSYVANNNGDYLHADAAKLKLTVIKDKNAETVVKNFQTACLKDMYVTPVSPGTYDKTACITAVKAYRTDCLAAFKVLIEGSAKAVRAMVALPPSVEAGKTLSAQKVEAMKKLADAKTEADKIEKVQNEVATLVMNRLGHISGNKASKLGQNQASSESGISTMGTAIMITVLVVLVLAVLIVALLAVRQYRSGPSSAV